MRFNTGSTSYFATQADENLINDTFASSIRTHCFFLGNDTKRRTGKQSYCNETKVYLDTSNMLITTLVF